MARDDLQCHMKQWVPWDANNCPANRSLECSAALDWHARLYSPEQRSTVQLSPLSTARATFPSYFPAPGSPQAEKISLGLLEYLDPGSASGDVRVPFSHQGVLSHQGRRVAIREAYDMVARAISLSHMTTWRGIVSVCNVNVWLRSRRSICLVQAFPCGAKASHGVSRPLGNMYLLKELHKGILEQNNEQTGETLHEPPKKTGIRARGLA